jgi:hypothetical protein
MAAGVRSQSAGRLGEGWSDAFASKSAERFGEAFADDVVLEASVARRPIEDRDQVMHEGRARSHSPSAARRSASFLGQDAEAPDGSGRARLLL